MFPMGRNACVAACLLLAAGCGEDADGGNGVGGAGATGGTHAGGGVGATAAGGVGGSGASGGSNPGCDDPDLDGYGVGPECLGPDCAPDHGGVHPGAEEVCNGLDDNCNDEPDEGLTCPPTLWVFLLAGQSNMVGVGFNNELPAPQQSLVDGATIFYDDSVHPNSNTLSWLPLGPGFGVVENRFGPELSFGRRMRQLWPDRNIALLKVAEGGTALHDRWAASSGDLYQLLVNHVQAQMQWLAEEHDGQRWRPQIVGLLWMQGESDALDLSDSLAYGANFESFLWTLRTDVGVPIIPTTAGLISPAGGWDYVDIVRDHTISTADRIGQVDVVETNDLPTQPADIFHYTSQSYLTLGERFADSAAALVPTTWNNIANFTHTQGDGFWLYLQRSAGTSEFVGWDEGQGRYSNGDASVWLGPDSVHPSATHEAELGWWAPYNGRASVTVTVADLDAAGGDGVSVEIAQEATTLRGPTAIPNGGSAQYSLEVDLAQGQVLSFRTSSGPAQDALHDATAWTIDIVMAAHAF